MKHRGMMTPTRLQIAVEQEYGKPWQQVLSELLYTRRLTHEQAAKRLDIKRSTLSYWVLRMRQERIAVAS